MKLVVAKVERRVDWLEGLKVDVDLLLLSLFCDDGAAVDDQAVDGHFGVELEPVLDGGDGAQHGQPVHPGLDVRRRAVLVRQHLGHSRHLWFRNRTIKSSQTDSFLILKDTAKTYFAYTK